MKKLLSLLVAVAFVTSASAQIKVQENFESGEYGKARPWKTESCSIVDGKNGSKVIEAKNGFFFDIVGLKEGETYKVKFDAKYNWGKNDSSVAVMGMNKETKKLSDFKVVELEKDNKFKTVEFEFTVESAGYHRLVFRPTGQFQFDNILVEKAQ